MKISQVATTGIFSSSPSFTICLLSSIKSFSPETVISYHKLIIHDWLNFKIIIKLCNIHNFFMRLFQPMLNNSPDSWSTTKSSLPYTLEQRFRNKWLSVNNLYAPLKQVYIKFSIQSDFHQDYMMIGFQLLTSTLLIL